ncbi:MAG: hypothetical protein ACYC3I_14915 [Gemmataceae bacterium]
MPASYKRIQNEPEALATTAVANASGSFWHGGRIECNRQSKAPESQFRERPVRDFSDSRTAAKKKMLYKLGRLLQIVGLILLPLAIAGNLAPERPMDLRSSLTLSGVGVTVFVGGYLLQQLGRK